MQQKPKLSILKSIFFILILIPFFGKTQINDEKIRLQVLKKNVINNEIVFGKWNERGGTETHLKYLGKVKTLKGRTYKVMNSIWIWGLSKKATNRILVFNENNQYLGNYYVTLDTDLPTEIKDGILIFKNTDIDCDKNLVSKINLKKGLPRQFFRKCKNEYGNIYSFDGTN